MKSSIASIESFSTVDGPGIRTVVFFNECKLRCIYCHNPEMWCKQNTNMTVDDVLKKIINNLPYFKETGGVTFSGGEPLLQSNFIIELCKKLKEYNIHTALDTAGIGNGDYEKILKYIDLIILDIKHVEKEGFKRITQIDSDEYENFIETANKLNKKVWIRQVIVPGITDTKEYIASLKEYIKRIKLIEKVEFLPYHKLGREKFLKLGIKYPCENIPEMDIKECEKLFEFFKSL